MGRGKKTFPDLKVYSKPPRKPRRKTKYLVTFEVKENINGNFEKTTVIIKSNIEKFLGTMQSENHKFNIIYMFKL